MIGAVDQCETEMGRIIVDLTWALFVERPKYQYRNKNTNYLNPKPDRMGEVKPYVGYIQSCAIFFMTSTNPVSFTKPLKAIFKPYVGYIQSLRIHYSVHYNLYFYFNLLNFNMFVI